MFADDAGGYVEQTYHADRWLHEIDANLAGPMVRTADGQDFYVHEPALASIDGSEDAVPVLPTRWFQFNEEHWGMAHKLLVNSDLNAFVIDGSACIKLPLSAFKLCMQRLERSFEYHHLPAPHRLEGKFALHLHK
jgi:hypothetical protein